MLRLRSLGEDMLFGPMAAKDTLHSFGELLIALSVGAVRKLRGHTIYSASVKINIYNTGFISYETC